jgi:hypothetical protein
MAPRLEPESRRLLTAFSANLNRLDPQALDWQRFYDFILDAFGHEPPSAEALGHALVQNGLDWDEAEPFMLFYRHDRVLRDRVFGALIEPPREATPEARRAGTRAHGRGRGAAGRAAPRA